MNADLEWPQPSTVYAIDDDDSFRTSLVRLLSVAGLHAVGYRCAGDFLLDRVRTQEAEEPACILLDILMPGPSGIDLMKALVSRDAALPIIFLTGRDDVFTSVDAMKGGAFDYLVKPARIERMLSTIGKALHKDVEQRAAQCELREVRLRFANLNASERAIFRGVVQHRLNKQMAVELDVCERTVKTLRSRMMEKLQLTTVPDLVRVARMLENVGIEEKPVRCSPREYIRSVCTVKGAECRSW
jgi:FixJ family two-component response regulator